MNDTMFNIFTQAIGIIAMGLFVLCFQFKNKKILFTLQLIEALLFTIQFALLKSWGGCLLDLCAVIRMIFLLFINDERKRKISLYLSILLYIVVSIIVIVLKLDSLLVLLILASCILQTVGLFQTSTKKCRLYQMLGSSPGWLIYDFCSGSIGGVICEVLAIISSAIYLYRYRNVKDI